MHAENTWLLDIQVSDTNTLTMYPQSVDVSVITINISRVA